MELRLRCRSIILGVLVISWCVEAAWMPFSVVPPANQAAGDLRTATDPVTLRIVVLDNEGQPVDDLRKEELRVFEDGKEQSISSFSHGAAQPLTVGLLMQWSTRRQNDFPYGEVEPAAQFFKATLKENDSGFVAIFADVVAPLTNITNSPAEIDRGLRQATHTPLHGGSALYDSIIWACGDKLGPKNANRVLVIVGLDDNLSNHSSNQAIDSALQSQTTIYFLNPDGDSSSQVGHEISARTGGEAITIRNPDDWTAAFRKISDQLLNSYVVGYLPTNEVPNGKYHKLKIQTTRTGLLVEAAAGHYALKK